MKTAHIVGTLLLGIHVVSINMFACQLTKRINKNSLSYHFCTQANSNTETQWKSLSNITQHKFSVAPMLDYTDCHQHYFQRLLSNEAILYTEMIGASTLFNSDNNDRHLAGYLKYTEKQDHPKTVLQLGGSNIQEMAYAAQVANKYGIKEININSGCPSDRVAGEGCFGAALMRRPDLVAELALAIGGATSVPATVKCRIGVDDDESYELLANYVRIISERGFVRHFVIHARKAVLGGKFSPADNRKIPPLKYDYVYRLVRDFPQLAFTLNGGVKTYEDGLAHIAHGVHGVMVGRGAIDDPYYWSRVDSKLYGVADPDLTPRLVLQKYAEYCRSEETSDPRCRRAVLKPILNLFAGRYNGRLFRHRVDVLTSKGSTNMLIADVLIEVSKCLPDYVLDNIPPPPSVGLVADQSKEDIVFENTVSAS